jgi:predicted anti-sigma-YlaC factor YlaD
MNQPDRHFSEADLLDTYYMQPGASMPVMMHLADCTDCAARYERLEKKVRGLTACAHDEKPETFWARQRISVMRTIDAQRRSSVSRITRVAAAAILIAGLGGIITWQQLDTPPAAVPTPEIAVQVTTPADPWESEELDEFHSIVAWESWETNGDQSL